MTDTAVNAISPLVLLSVIIDRRYHQPSKFDLRAQSVKAVVWWSLILCFVKFSIHLPFSMSVIIAAYQWISPFDTNKTKKKNIFSSPIEATVVNYFGLYKSRV